MANKYVRKTNTSALLLGILVGVFSTCMIVLIFSTSNITLKMPSNKSKTEKTNKLVAGNLTTPKAIQEPHFDFYTELAKTNSDTVAVTVSSADLKSTEKPIARYIVQAGCFKKITDADAIKAKLMLNGYAAKIEMIKGRDGASCNQVMLGTFKTEKNAKTIQKQLKDIEVNSTIVHKYAD